MDLQLKTLEIKPAKVDFNYKELLDIARHIKAQYENLYFEEGTIRQAKDTAAEIRRIQKSVDDFKKKTKKELTQEVKAFEEQCKQIIAEFQDPLNHITSQLDAFEQKRIESKRKVIENEILILREKSGVDDKFWNLEFNDKWLNKSVGIGQVTQDVLDQISKMVDAQNAYINKMELIETYVELANAKYSLNVLLSAEQFKHYAEYKEAADIKEIVFNAAELQEKQEKLYAERVQQEKEAEAFKKSAETISKITEHAQAFAPVESKEEEPLITSAIRIKGTRAQFDALKRYLQASGIEVI